MMEDQVEEVEHEVVPTHLTIFHCIGLIILLVVLQLLASMLLSKTHARNLDEAAWPSLAITHAVSGLLTAKAGAILAGFSLLGFFRPFRIGAKHLLPLIVAVSGITILSSELSNLLQAIQPMPDSYVQLFNGLLQQNAAGVLLAVGIIAPATEELIFRGVMLDGLRQHYSASIAFLISTTLFAMVHVLPWLVINAFLIGSFLAWVKLKTESLPLCVIAHALYNSVPFLMTQNLNLNIPGFTTVASSRVQFQPIWFDLMGVVLLAAGMAGLKYFATGQGKSEI